MRMQTLAHLDDRGHIVYENYGPLCSALRVYAGERVIVTIETIDKSKSSNQMGFYRGVVLPTIHETLANSGLSQGTKEQTHRALKMEFGKVNDDGEPVSLSQYNRKQMAEFLDAIMSWAATELGCTFPKRGEEQ